MIHGVTGPNEYENNVNNNWYTNRIAAWELAYTAEQLMLIPREKAQTLSVNAEEIRRFREISEKMYSARTTRSWACSCSTIPSLIRI